ncbi:MAG TPA: long-chain fatty acid--CoA ligase [Blastocatellia bacterium]|nr:long-chain fatty acid--CoA ligase [Blastocatellia bacterium]
MTPTDEPRTINELFMQAVSRRADRVIMRYKRQKVWHEITGAQLDERVRNVSLGLVRLGVEPGDRVALLAESSPEWSIADYAILACGGINVPVYPTQSVEQVGFILRNSGARVLFVSNQKQLKRVQPALDSLGGSGPKLIMFESPKEEIRAVTLLDDLEKRGAEERTRRPGIYREMVTKAQPDDLATIIYTSGTTGEPKGVMLTHRNLVTDALRSAEVFSLNPDDEALSFLPLAHVFERTVLYIYMHLGVRVSFARGVEYVAEDIREVRPTVVTAVPRLFERILATINKKAADAPPAQQKVFQRALKIGREIAALRDQRKSVPFTLRLQYGLYDRLVFSKWREAVGGRIRFFVSGGAALPTEIALTFAGAGLIILQGYGLTETSPVVAVNRLDDNRFGTIGQAIPGVKVKTAEDGELLVQGDIVMQGYYQNAEETEKALERQGDGVWFRTGDIGTIDEGGFIRITDRKKDLIKTSLGKYIAPQMIENLIRGIPLVEQVVVIGNSRKYPAALIVPGFEGLRAYADSLSLNVRDKAELVRHPRVVEFFKKKVDEVTRELAPYEKIKKIALLEKEFTIESGELTPTLKVRRRFVEEKYREVIDALYPKVEVEA